MRTSEKQRATRIVIVMVAALVAICCWTTSASAQDLGANARYKVVGKNGLAFLTIYPDRFGQTRVSTIFQFHPSDIQTNVVKKQFEPGTVIRTGVGHAYSKNEIHGTSGVAEHTLNFGTLTFEGESPKLFVSDGVDASIRPGMNEIPTSVGVAATLADPNPFSDTSPDALLGFYASGLEIPFSLEAGTAFPSQFTTVPGPGADPSQTLMAFHLRVAPGVISDPEAFWSDGLAAAVDLFSLTLQSDANFNVHANLVTGASTANFAVDANGVATAAATIENSFQGTGGQLMSTLEDIFSVGFTPLGVQEYTVGFADEVRVAGWETPEPPTVALLSAGAVLLATTFLARRARQGHSRKSPADGRSFDRCN